MKTTSFLPLCLITLLVSLTGCEVIGGIFKASVWVGIIAVVVVIGFVGLPISKAGKK